MSDAKRCDNCGIHGYAPYQGWRHVELIDDEHPRVGTSKIHHFCSWACIAQRAQLMEQAEQTRLARLAGGAKR